MKNPSRINATVGLPLSLILITRAIAADDSAPGAGARNTDVLHDKTLVAWVSPANLAQRGGTVLTIDDGQSHFDGIIFGEIESKKWMPGSDFFNRSIKEQTDWPDETADSQTFVQVAIVYYGREVSTRFCGSPGSDCVMRCGIAGLL